MIGALVGDIIGSVYEHRPIKTTEFALFGSGCRCTDDSVLTIAVAILNGVPYDEAIWHWGNRYPYAGYGGSFRGWLRSSDRRPYQSWGNGSAMRVAPVGWAFDWEAKVMREARRTAEVTHDHPEGIKGAEAVALAVFLARTGHDKQHIRSVVSERFGYDLDRSVDEIRPLYRFDVSCRGSVPEAIVAFLIPTPSRGDSECRFTWRRCRHSAVRRWRNRGGVLRRGPDIGSIGGSANPADGADRRRRVVLRTVRDSVLRLVGKVGLEPTRLATLEPKSSASANFATRPGQVPTATPWGSVCNRARPGGGWFPCGLARNSTGGYPPPDGSGLRPRPPAGHNPLAPT